MNPLSLIPNWLRVTLYVVYGAGVVVFKYTQSRGWTGPDELDLWLNLGIVVGVAAASNVPVGTATPNVAYTPRHSDADADGKPDVLLSDETVQTGIPRDKPWPQDWPPNPN